MVDPKISQPSVASHWIVWQLLDSSFPAGAFAHSAGLEAAWQSGWISDAATLVQWLRWQLHQSAHFSGAMVSNAFLASENLLRIDLNYDALLSNHVANRASRAQGQGLLMAATRIFNTPCLHQLASSLRTAQSPGHLAPVFGVIARSVHLTHRQAIEGWLFLSLRGTISAAVRLGAAGTLEGQAIQHQLGPYMRSLADEVLADEDAALISAAQTAPLLDLLQGTQDRLYSRLFQS